MAQVGRRRTILSALGFQDLFVILGFASLLLVQLFDFTSDPGVGWHLATGQWISQHSAVPTLDPFLFSAAPRNWIADQWLSDWLLFELYSWGGWGLLAALGTLIYAGTFFLIVYPTAQKLSGSAFAAAMATLLVFKIGQVHFILRPVLLAFPCFALVVLFGLKIATRIREAEEPILTFKDVLALLLVFTLWANLHPSFVLGLGAIGVIFVTTLAEVLVVSRRLPSTKQLMLGLLLLLSCGLVTLINPYGIRLHQSIIQLASDPFFMSFHQEWISPSFRSLEGHLFEIIIGLVLISLFFFGPAAELPWAAFFLFLIFSHAALQAVRLLPFFGIVAAVPLALGLGRIWRRPGTEDKIFFRLLGRIDRYQSSASTGLITFGVCSLILFSLLSGYWKSPQLENFLSPSDTKFPLATIRCLRQVEGSQQLVLVAPPEWGGMITWEGQGAIKAVIDDRNTLLGASFYKTFFEQLAVGKNWTGYAQSLGANYIMLPVGSGLAQEAGKISKTEPICLDSVAVAYKLPR